MTTPETPGVTVGLLEENVEKKENTTLTQRLIQRGDYFSNKRFAVLAIVFQLALIVLFAVFSDYKIPDAKINATAPASNDEIAQSSAKLNRIYPGFQNLHVLVFVGFGFLATFLRKYGYSSIGFNFVIAAFVIQFYFIAAGLLRFNWNTWVIPIDIQSLIKSDFAAAAVLISLGALLGKLSPEQYLLLGFFEIIFYSINEYIIMDVFNVNDPGRAIVVHIFGAYFGLVVSRILYKPGVVGHANETALYNFDLFSIIGTLFLWMFWPTINSIFLVDELQHRAIVNTYFGLGASCLMAFAVSSLLNEKGKFEMIHIQNATLAGGVAIAAVANLLITPFGALIIGSVAGILSVSGFRIFGPCFTRRFNLHDTRGVHFLHGIPGIFGAIVAAGFAFFASEGFYGKTLYNIYPAMKAVGGQEARCAKWQAGMQLVAVGVTLLIALIGGAVTGFLLRMKPCKHLESDEHFEDSAFWQVANKGECRCVVAPGTQETELQQKV